MGNQRQFKRNTEETSAVPHRVGGWLKAQPEAPPLAEHLTQLLRLRTQQPPRRITYDWLTVGFWDWLHTFWANPLWPPACHWFNTGTGSMIHAAWVSLKDSTPQHMRTTSHHYAPQPLPAFRTREWKIMSRSPSITIQMALALQTKTNTG